jgi:hypothetical protein
LGVWVPTWDVCFVQRPPHLGAAVHGADMFRSLLDSY